jgi:hypothetical protein
LVGGGDDDDDGASLLSVELLKLRRKEVCVIEIRHMEVEMVEALDLYYIATILAYN